MITPTTSSATCDLTVKYRLLDQYKTDYERQKKLYFTISHIASIIITITLPSFAMLATYSIYQYATLLPLFLFIPIAITTTIYIFIKSLDFASSYFQKKQENLDSLKSKYDEFNVSMLNPTNNIPIVNYRYPCTEEHVSVISKIITTLNRESKTSLLFHHQRKLEALGKRIHKIVHPLQFLRVILTSQLINELRGVRRDIFKYTPFIRRLSNDLNDQEHIDKQAKEFASDLSIDFSTLEKHVVKKDWKSFVNILLDNL